MGNANTYLGPHIQLGPGSYEIGPVSIQGERLPNFGGGGYFSGAWGLHEGPHRGTSGGSKRPNASIPFIWDDLMREQRENSKYIDAEYASIFRRLTETTIRELEQARKSAIGIRRLSSLEKAKVEHEATITAIQSKESEYQTHIKNAHSLYGQNPFFLMRELSFRKIWEGFNASPPNITAAYPAIDTAYRSALELKRLSL